MDIGRFKRSEPTGTSTTEAALRSGIVLAIGFLDTAREEQWGLIRHSRRSTAPAGHSRQTQERLEREEMAMVNAGVTQGSAVAQGPSGKNLAKGIGIICCRRGDVE